MAQMQIRGSSQIMTGTIPASALQSSLNLPTAQLAEGALFIKSTGTVAMGASLNMGGFTIINSAVPVNPTDVVIKSYVDGLLNGIQFHPFCRVVATANSAVTGLLTIDGVTLSAGDRVLLVAQTTASQNGPWVVAGSAWVRPLDWSQGATVSEGAYFIIEPDGTTYKNTKWWCTNTGNIIVGTTPTTFSQDLSGTIYQAGDGINLSGVTFSAHIANGLGIDGSQAIQVIADGTNLSVSASGVKIANGSAGQVVLAGASGVAAMTSLSGDATVNSAGVVTVNSTSGSGFIKYGAHVWNETPSGAVNGVNTAFTLANTPSTNALQFYMNGMLLEPGAGNDYTLSGTLVTMLFAPIAGDKIRAYYIK